MVTFSQLLHGICTRPHIYVPNGTFREVAAFLTGYATGQAPTGQYTDSELHRFAVWLARRLGVGQNWIWWHVLLHTCDNDEKRALQELPKLYAEYVADCKDRITAHPDTVLLTDEQKQDLQDRLDAASDNPKAGSPWEEVRERLRGEP